MGVHDGHRQRMKQRFLEHGIDNFNDINALELLLFYALFGKKFQLEKQHIASNFAYNFVLHFLEAALLPHRLSCHIA